MSKHFLMLTKGETYSYWLVL